MVKVVVVSVMLGASVPICSASAQELPDILVAPPEDQRALQAPTPANPLALDGEPDRDAAPLAGTVELVIDRPFSLTDTLSDLPVSARLADTVRLPSHLSPGAMRLQGTAIISPYDGEPTMVRVDIAWTAVVRMDGFVEARPLDRPLRSALASPDDWVAPGFALLAEGDIGYLFAEIASLFSNERHVKRSGPDSPRRAPNP